MSLDNDQLVAFEVPSDDNSVNKPSNDDILIILIGIPYSVILLDLRSNKVPHGAESQRDRLN